MSKDMRVQLLHIYGSSVTGEEWQWSAELERREESQVYLVLMPTVDEGVDVEAPDPVAIESGSDLFDALDKAWYCCAGEPLGEKDWHEISAKLTEFDGALGVGLKKRLTLEYDDAEVGSEAEAEVEAELWFQRSTWPRAFTGRPVGYQAAGDVRRSGAVRQYIRDHRVQTGRLPVGRHVIRAENFPGFEVSFPESA